jgi:NADH:ubiquinone oxidoreductase subunit 6 (subunit J)
MFKKVSVWILIALVEVFFAIFAVVGAGVALFGSTATEQFWGALMLIVCSALSAVIYMTSKKGS